jgi:cytochrome b subunit of formate dehydrogenase
MIPHYIVMIFATLAGIIGLSQAFPDWSAAQAFLGWLGGGLEGGLEIKRSFHHYFCYFVDVTVLYFIIYLLYKFFFKKGYKSDIIPKFQDLKDMINMNFYILGLRKEEPKYCRYTFGQKIDFYLILVGIPVLSITGLLMHYTTISEPVITGLGVSLCVVIHRSVALFLAWFILSVHLYYAHLAPGLFPMNTVILTGKMSKARYEFLFPLDSERLQEESDNSSSLGNKNSA